MRNKREREIRTNKEDIMVGIKVKDKETGDPAMLIKGKGGKYDTLTVQEIASALYGVGTEILIKPGFIIH